MPIEDVDYLKQNSIKQSYIFLSDSADRDRSLYPTPSQYVLTFNTPFTNVIGMEVLDASIPRTMFNVDSNNNKVAFYIYGPSGSSSSNALPPPFKTVAIDVGEYTIQTLLPKLTEALEMHPGDDMLLPKASITASSLSDPPDVLNTIRFHCPYSFAFDMRPLVSTIAETLGFDLLAAPAEADVTAIKRRYDAPWAPEQPSAFKSVDLPQSTAMGEERVIFEGPRGVIRNIQFETPNFKVAQRFTTPSKGYLTGIYVAFSSAELNNTALVSYQILQQDPANANAPVVASGSIAISYIDGGLSDAVIQAPYVELTPTTTYWLVLSCPNSSIGVFYNDNLPGSVGTNSLVTYTGSGPTSGGANVIDADGISYQMSARIVVNDEYHSLTAPGIYSLVGPRYILLRCPEIEENSFRSLAYNNHFMGLAKIRLGNVGYSENRLEFSKIPLREFHPIGRLSRLTLKFTLPNGQLYDFKGVNHTVTFAIQYYEPTPQKKFEQSLLQPNYKGNIMDYLFNADADADDDSDEDSDEIDERQINDYRQQELMYLPEQVRRRDLEALSRFPMQDFE